MSGFPRKSGSGGDRFKSPRLSMHAEDCQSHKNVGQGAAPGLAGGKAAKTKVSFRSLQSILYIKNFFRCSPFS